MLSKRQTSDVKSYSTPKIEVEYLEKIIRAYNVIKEAEAENRILSCQSRTSPTMQSLNTFHRIKKLKNNFSILTIDECFDLVKILFTANKRDGEKTKHVINSILLAHFHPKVVAALDSFVAKGRPGCLEILRPHFENMCKNPDDAASIAYGILVLDDFLQKIERERWTINFYSKSLFNDSIKNPEIAVSILELSQALNRPHSGKEIYISSNVISNGDFLKADSRFYILYRTYIDGKKDIDKVLTELHKIENYTLTQLRERIYDLGIAYHKNTSANTKDRPLISLSTFSTRTQAPADDKQAEKTPAAVLA